MPEEIDPAAFAKWADTAPDKSPEVSPVDEFADFLKTNGLMISGSPVLDGTWHRVPVDGDRKGQSGRFFESCSGTDLTQSKVRLFPFLPIRGLIKLKKAPSN